MIDSNNNTSSFNLNFVDLDHVNNDRLVDSSESTIDVKNLTFINQNHAAISSKLNNNNTDSATKFNSYPTRSKKLNKDSSSNVKIKSSSSIGYKNINQIMISQDELNLNVRLAKTRSQESDRLKQFLRSNIWPAKHPIRKYLWKTLLQVSSSNQTSASNKENKNHNNGKNHSSSHNSNKIDFSNNESEYNNSLNQIFGKSRDIEISMPDFVNNSFIMNSSVSSANSSNNLTNNYSNHLNYYYLNENGKQAIKRILCVYEYNHPHVTFSPALVSISSILLHYMQEHEVFAALCFMSSTKDHLIESKSSWDTSCSVFIRLLKNYCKSSYDTISKYAIESVELIYSEWYWWIFECLSFDNLVKVMDCFLHEGQKILYRVGLAIVQQFSKYVEFIEDCEYLNELFLDVVKTENLKVNKDSIRQFLETDSNIESIERLLKVSFSIRNLKRSTIKDFFHKEETKRKNLNNTSPTEHSKALTKIDENQLSDHSPTRVFLHETSTNLLSHAHLCTIWSWIPQRLTVYSPQMLFTTHEHGTSFNTLFNVLDQLEYSLLTIKTFNNEIFGAFCSCHWTDRRQKTIYFGNGETFLFKLAPEKKIYRWIGARKQEQKIEANQEMFIRADNTKLAVGGGGKDGLSIFSNLTEGTSNKCDTFENDPLSSVEHFQIAVLEVIGFEIK